ncbi:hypothetical protein [Rubritalea profundi]|uniref:hypothetical protein n=1 Tax=Rubritalea profundi TaxID=1658618 RepID=UPI001F0CCCD4|nr:hypothetical protein [Rubritalea profundi]
MSQLCRLRFNKVSYHLDVSISSPHVTQEIGWVDLAMAAEKVAVATTAKHDVRVELTAELVLSFTYDAGR